MTSTGWFGVPGRRMGSTVSTKVHFVENHRPICGARIHPLALYQWCSRGMNWDYLECRNCKRVGIARKEAELRALRD